MTPDLRVGVITRPHGIRGELRVYPTTESPDRFKEFKSLKLKRAGDDIALCELKVEGAKTIGRMAVIKLRGIDSVEDANGLRGMELYIPREEGVKLSDGEYYIGDIIDMKVIDESGDAIGKVRDVLETGANNVYIVERDNKRDLLVPAIPECVLDVDIENNIMTVHIMDGLEGL